MSMRVDATVAWLTWRQLFTRPRRTVALLAALVPIAIAIIYRFAHPAPEEGAAAFLAVVYREIVIGTLLPLVALVLGTTSFAGEVDDGTIVHLLVKPIRRWRVVLAKYAVSAVATVAILAPAVLLSWAAVGTVAAAMPLAFLAGAAAGAAVYCALFVMLGIVYRRALVYGLVYIVVLEFVLSRHIAGLRSLSVREFALAVAARGADGAPGMLPANVSSATVWTMSAIIGIGSLLLAVRRYQRYEMAERL
jgi:ABC-2 type transport system permease protein